ncbi:MAG: flavodoxin family protein [Clostridiales bacterium]|mgnify:CR=1 FL=1|nr:flavodoxin family protein [Clostridiales bacterium]
MNLIIHDLEPNEWETLGQTVQKNTKIIDKQGDIRKCIGCFGCWVKTPGQCVIADDYQKMGELLAQTDKLTIISRCCFGSYSSFVKNVMDRSISYILPYFEIRKGEMHHKARYRNRINIEVVFYGTGITENEKATASKLVEANALNLNASVHRVLFVKEIGEIKEVLK